jgi:hypothetical protein
MNKIGWSIAATVGIFFASTLIIAPLISNFGYSSVESSYHLWTHALLVALIFTIILCTMLLLEEISGIKTRFNDDNKKQ